MITRKKLVIGGGSAGLVVIAAVMIGAWANQPLSVTPQVQGAVTTEPSTDSTHELAISSQYYHTTIAGEFRVIKREGKQPDQIYDRLVAIRNNSDNDCQLAITIAALPSTGLNSVADIQLRRSNTAVYKPTMLDEAPAGSLMFKGTNPLELDFFASHEKYYASVALTSGSNLASCTALMTGVLQEWQWL